MLDPKYIPLFIGGFIAWICFMIFVGWITSRGKNEGSSFLTGGGNLGFFLIFCTVGATMIGTGSSMGAIGNGFNHGWAAPSTAWAHRQVSFPCCCSPRQRTRAS